MKKKKIVFVSSDKIDDFAHDLIERVFGISGAWISNESLLDDFEPLDSIPGHILIPLSEVSNQERHHYEKDLDDLIKPDSYYVWYPPVSEGEWKGLARLNRKFLLGKVENEYKISMENYPGNTPLYVWEVARFVKNCIFFL